MASDGTTAARLIVEVGAKGINETAAGLGRMDSAVRGTSQGIGGLVKGALSIYAVKSAFDATIGSAISWESEFAGVEKTVDGTSNELAALEGELLQMHRTMPVARADLAGIAESAGALGIATSDIGEFTETVAQIGATTNVSSEMAATALGKLSNVLHLTEDDFDNFGAALVDLGNKGASTEQEILGIAERAGAGASLIDMAADSTLGWSAAVANLGIEAEAGGSALQRFFLEMTTHVAAAGAELNTIAQTAGMTASEFTRAFGEDSSAALQAFIGGMEDLTQAEQLALLEMLGFSDVRISRTLLGLAGDTENLNEALTVGSEAWEANTALIEEYGKRADTTASKIEVLGNRLGDLGRRVGEEAPGDVLLGIGDAVVGGLEDMFYSAEVAGENLANNFGGRLTNLKRLSEDTGVALGVVGSKVADAMVDEGLVFEDAFRQVRDSINGIPPVMDDATRQALAAWKQADLGGVIEDDVVAGINAAAAATGSLAGMMADELLANQFVLTDATTELVNFMETAISPLQEKFNAQAFLASEELAAGLDSGIPSVKKKAEEMRDEALAVLNIDGSAWGYNLGSTYADGMGRAIPLVEGAARGIASATGRQIGIESEPDDPSSPLAGITHWGGNIAKTIADDMMANLGILDSASNAIAAAARPDLGAGAGVGFGAGGATSTGGGETHIHFHLNVEGDLKASNPGEVMDAFGRMAFVTGFSDRSLVGE